MKLTRYVALAAFSVAVILLGTRMVNAQSQVQQVYGAGGGEIAGYVYGFDMYNQLEPIAWAPVTANDGQYSFVAYTGGGGYYEMYVPQGTYNVTVNEPGFVPQTISVAVSPGSANTAINMYLYQSHIPVPEFPSGAVSAITIVALAAVLVAAKRTKRRK